MHKNRESLDEQQAVYSQIQLADIVKKKNKQDFWSKIASEYILSIAEIKFKNVSFSIECLLEEIKKHEENINLLAQNGMCSNIVDIHSKHGMNEQLRGVLYTAEEFLQ